MGKGPPPEKSKQRARVELWMAPKLRRTHSHTMGHDTHGLLLLCGAYTVCFTLHFWWMLLLLMLFLFSLPVEYVRVYSIYLKSNARTLSPMSLSFVLLALFFYLEFSSLSFFSLQAHTAIVINYFSRAIFFSIICRPKTKTVHCYFSGARATFRLAVLEFNHSHNIYET